MVGVDGKLRCTIPEKEKVEEEVKEAKEAKEEEEEEEEEEGWAGPTTLLCVYGFCSMMRPIEPFMTEFLSGPDKNLTTGQLTHQVYPVVTYSNILLVVPVLLVTDWLRYKPVIVLQALCNLLAFLLLMLGPSGDAPCARWAFFVYSLGSAADVAYFSYIYSLVRPGRYQRATGYARSAVLLGYAAGATLGQLLVSVFAVTLRRLAAVSVASLAAALAAALFLPMPPEESGREGDAGGGGEGRGCGSGSGADATEGPGCAVGLCARVRARSLRALRSASGALQRLAADCVACYSSVVVAFFCVWFAAGRCGFYQVASYVQVLWLDKQPQHNFTAYNGAVDALATLSGAAASLAVGHISIDWAVWGEVILGGFTALITGALFLMNLTDNIWVSYACFVLFKALYMQLTTMCTFQIAKSLRLERYALVFGLNSFLGTILQTALTGVVINTRSLRLTLSSQPVHVPSLDKKVKSLDRAALKLQLRLAAKRLAFNKEVDEMAEARKAFQMEKEEFRLEREAFHKQRSEHRTHCKVLEVSEVGMLREASYNEAHYIKTQNMAQTWNTVNSNPTSPEARPGSEWELHVFQ
ncbi:unnamed protein product [Lota lota]